MDTEAVLKMVVDVMVNGSGNFDELREKLNGLNDETKKAAPLNEDLGESHKKLATNVISSRAEHVALRNIFVELNREIPGLGHVLHVLEIGFESQARSAKAAAVANEEVGASADVAAAGMTGEAAAAGEAAVATDALMASFLPLALIMVSIQAIITLWGNHKKATEDAQKANDEFFKKFDEDTKKALTAWQEFQAAMHPEQSATKKITDDVEMRIALLEIQTKTAHEKLKVDEDAALAGAKTPEEKKAIQDAFDQKNKAVDDQSKGSKIEIQGNAIQDINTELKKTQDAMDALRAKISEEAKPKTVTTSYRNRSGIHTESHQVHGTPETPEEFDQEKKLTKDAGELNSKKEDLQNDVNIGTVTRAAERDGQIDVEKAKIITGGKDSTVAAGISALNASGGKLNEAQKQQYDALKSIFDTLIGNHDALKGALITSHNLMLTQAQEIALIQGQLKTLASKQ